VKPILVSFEPFEVNSISVPSIRMTVDAADAPARVSVVFVPGYGGNKEEILGFCARAAALGMDACAIDLRGHGENQEPYDGRVMDDLNAIIRVLRKKSRVVGHSLGRMV